MTNNLISSGALFRANPQLLKSPLPYHITLQQQQQQQQQHQQNLGQSPLGPSSRSPSSSVASLFRPQPVYAKFNNNVSATAASPLRHSAYPPHVVNSPSVVDSHGFKVPMVPNAPPVSTSTTVTSAQRKDEEFNINDYLDLNHTPAIPAPSTPSAPVASAVSTAVDTKTNDDNSSKVKAALDSLRPVDDEIKSLVDSIHSEVLSQIAAQPPPVEAETAPEIPQKQEEHIQKEDDKSAEIEKESAAVDSDKAKIVVEEVEEIVESAEQTNEEQEIEKQTAAMSNSRKTSPQKKPRVKKKPKNVYDNPPELPKSSALFEKYVEKYPGVHFEKWWLLPLRMDGSTTLHLVIEGLRRNGKDCNRWHSSIICDIKGSRCVVSKSGNRYWLHGKIALDMMNNSLELAKKFENGFFDGWQEYLQQLFDDHKEKERDERKQKKSRKSESKRSPRKTKRNSLSEERKSKKNSRIEKEEAENIKKSELSANESAPENEIMEEGQQHDEHENDKVESDNECDRENERVKLQQLREQRRHTMAALTASRKTVERSRSGRKIKPPRDYWNATELEYQKIRERGEVQVKLEWGTGRVKVIENPGGGRKLRRRSIPETHSNKEKDEDSEQEQQEVASSPAPPPPVQPVKRGRGRPRKYPLNNIIQKKQNSSDNEFDEVNNQNIISDPSSEVEIKPKPSRKAIVKEYYREEEDVDDIMEDEDERPWTAQEDRILDKHIWQFDPKSHDYWENIASNLPGRTAASCQRRYQCGFGRRKSVGPVDANGSPSPVNRKSKKKSSSNQVQVEKLAGKNTILRKRQLRQIMNERAMGHEDDIFGADEVDRSSSSAAASSPEDVKKHKRKLPESTDEDSPAVLKPFNRDDKDGYIESLKRRKLLQKTGQSKPSATMKNQTVGKIVRPKLMTSAAMSKKKTGKKKTSKYLDDEVEDDSEEQSGNEEEEEESDNEALDYYRAANGSSSA